MMSQFIILTVNTGNFSVLLSVFASHNNNLRLLFNERYEADAFEAGADASQELRRMFLQMHGMQTRGTQTHGLKGVDVVSHRVVCGGVRFTSATRLNEEVENAIGELSHLAPLH